MQGSKREQKKQIREKEDISKGMKVCSKKQCVKINWKFCDLFDFPNVVFLKSIFLKSNLLFSLLLKD